MVLLDVFRVAICWLHLLAGVTWVGGSLFYLLVLVPAARASDSSALRGALSVMDRRFRELVQLAIAVLIVTGALITFDRLQLEPGPAYVVTLGIKVGLALWMFVLAQNLASRSRRRLIAARRGNPGGQPATRSGRPGTTTLILAIGLVILLLSDVLKVIGPPA